MYELTFRWKRLRTLKFLMHSVPWSWWCSWYLHQRTDFLSVHVPISQHFHGFRSSRRFTPICDCPVDTELIRCVHNPTTRAPQWQILHCDEWCLCFSFYAFPTIQCTCPFEYRMSCFFELFHHFLKQWSPIFPLVLNHTFETTCLRFRVLWMPNILSHTQSWSMFSNFGGCQSTRFLVSLLVGVLSLNMDIKMILSLNFSGLMWDLSRSHWMVWRICNSVNPGKSFHSNSIDSPSIPKAH